MNKEKSGVLASAFEEADIIDMNRIMSDTSADWIPSDSFERRMGKIIRSEKKPYWRCVNTVNKRAACAVISLVVIFGTAVSVKAIREPIVDLFTKITGQSDGNREADITTAWPVSTEAKTDAPVYSDPAIESGPVKVSYMQFTGKVKFINSDTHSPFYRDLYDRLTALDWGKAELEVPTKKEGSLFYDYIMCDASIEFGEGDDVESYGISIVDSETYYLVHSIEHKETGKYISYYFVLKPTDPDGLFGVISQLVN